MGKLSRFNLGGPSLFSVYGSLAGNDDPDPRAGRPEPAVPV